MNQLFGHLLLLVIHGAIFASPAAVTDDKNAWLELFDGKTLQGWERRGGTGQFKVEDGCIVGYGEKIQGNTFLCTLERFDDFVLSYQFKFDDLRGNSGVMFRANQKPSKNGQGRVFGYQCEGDNRKDRAWTAGLYDEARRGWLFPNPAKEHQERRDWFSKEGLETFHWEDWNTITIRCKGNHIQTWLNGVKRVDFVDTNSQHDTREGFIGLQVHGGPFFEARWRRIRIRRL